MSLDRIRQALTGISGVHVTPYDAEGGIDRPLLTRIVRQIVDAGIHNLVAAGNTGEFYALTPEEVRQVGEAAVAAADGRAPVTAAVGRSLRDALGMARDAAAMGADAVMVHQPLDPFAAPVAQAEYFLAIAEESPLPVVAYVRSADLALDQLVRLAAHPNMAGVKYATPNLMLLAEAVRATGPGQAIWVCGLAEGWAAAMRAVGARGFTSGLVNVVPERSLAIHEALERSAFDEARALVSAIAPFEALRTRHNNGANVTVVKEALQLLGVPVGPVRPPGLPRLEPEIRARLADLLAEWGLLSAPRAAAE
jgi:4-hydroxy-tetrahydrodipicolinate synthase